MPSSGDRRDLPSFLHDALPISSRRSRAASLKRCSRCSSSPSPSSPRRWCSVRTPSECGSRECWCSACCGCLWSTCSHSTLNTSIRSEEHTSELQSRVDLVCRLLATAEISPLSYTTLFRSLQGAQGQHP